MGQWRKAVTLAAMAAAAAAAKPPHTHRAMTLEEEEEEGEEEGDDREKQLRKGLAKSNVRPLPRRENAGGRGRRLEAGWRVTKKRERNTECG